MVGLLRLQLWAIFRQRSIPTSRSAIHIPTHDGVDYEAGDSLEVSAKQATALIEAAVAKAGRDAIEGEVVAPPAPKPPTIKERFAAAEAEGLVLDVEGLKTHAEVDAAIEAARLATQD